MTFLNTSELWLQIDHLHLQSIKKESKLVLNDLNAKIRTYLSIVPHEKKFCFSMTQKIINDSVNMLPNFSFEDAIVSFENINVYATNLLRQPWRKEFENISVNGHFFKLIRRSLFEPEKLFTLIGYRNDRETMRMEGPIEFDKVIMVARDCLLAKNELMILKECFDILVQVQESNFRIQDILQCREKNICTAIEAARSVQFKHRKRYFINGEESADPQKLKVQRQETGGIPISVETFLEMERKEPVRPAVIEPPEEEEEEEEIDSYAESEEEAPPPDLEALEPENLDTWSCHACTYLNPNSTKICEICGKTKLIELEQQQQQKKQKQQQRQQQKQQSPKATEKSCLKCTLLNNANCKVCVACGCTLPELK